MGMIKEMEIGKLYRYIPTGSIAVVSRVEKQEITENSIYKLIYLNDPNREFNLCAKNYYGSPLWQLWEEVGTDPNWDCYNSSLAYG